MRWPGMCFCLLFLAAVLPAQQPSVVAGDYIEDRSNKVYGCYCEWSGERVTGGKEAILGWHVRSGEFQGVSLAGLRIAAVVMAESTLSAGSAPRRSLVFVDASAPSEQRQAGELWLRTTHKELLGDVAGVHPIAIEFLREGERASLRIGEMAKVELRKARPAEDALQGAVLWYDPLVPMTESTLGTTLNTRYRGQEFTKNWDLRDTGISGYFGSFRVER